jgi:hypothetical protein
MKVKQLLDKADQIRARAEQDTRSKEAASKAARLNRVEAILDEAATDPEKFIRIIRTQMGREIGLTENKRVLFTYRQVAYRATRDLPGGIDLMQEFFRQERGDELTEEEVTDEQLEQLWDAGVSIGRILSCDLSILNAWYQGRAKSAAPYVSVAHWARAHRVCQELGIEAVANTIEELMVAYYNRFGSDQLGEVFIEDLVEKYEQLEPGFKSVWGTVKEAV